MKEITLERREDLVAAILNDIAVSIRAVNPAYSLREVIDSVVYGMACARVVIEEEAVANIGNINDFLMADPFNRAVAVSAMMSKVVDAYIGHKNSFTDMAIRIEQIKEKAVSMDGSDPVNPVEIVMAIWHSAAMYDPTTGGYNGVKASLAMATLHIHSKHFTNYIMGNPLGTGHVGPEQMIGAYICSNVQAYVDACKESGVKAFEFNKQSIANTSPPVWWSPSVTH